MNCLSQILFLQTPSKQRSGSDTISQSLFCEQPELLELLDEATTQSPRAELQPPFCIQPAKPFVQHCSRLDGQLNLNPVQQVIELLLKPVQEGKHPDEELDDELEEELEEELEVTAPEEEVVSISPPELLEEELLEEEERG